MKTKWLVQTNVSADSPTGEQLRHACDAEGVPFVAFRHPPGTTCAPDIPIELAAGPIVFHARSPALLGALGTQVDGRLRFMECNCFNASRFYCADVRHIVKIVSEYQLQHGAMRRSTAPGRDCLYPAGRRMT